MLMVVNQRSNCFSLFTPSLHSPTLSLNHSTTHPKLVFSHFFFSFYSSLFSAATFSLSFLPPLTHLQSHSLNTLKSFDSKLSHPKWSNENLQLYNCYRGSCLSLFTPVHPPTLNLTHSTHPKLFLFISNTLNSSEQLFILAENKSLPQMIKSSCTSLVS